MPAILLKAQTGTTKSRREGNKTIIEKTVEKGVLTETHTDTSKRLRGKQSANQTVTLSAAEIKALDKVNDEKIAKGLGAGKAANARQLANMNIAANKAVGQVRAELKLATDKLARTEAELAMVHKSKEIAAAHEKFLARQRAEAREREEAKEKRAEAKERAAKRGKK